jgi:predicted nucleotidyltransferase
MKLSAKDIQLIKDDFSRQPVSKTYLFGSYSRNDADMNSDVDILVDLDYSKHIRLGFVTMQTELEQKLKKKLTLSPPTPFQNTYSLLLSRIKF